MAVVTELAGELPEVIADLAGRIQALEANQAAT
jgi:hypothetical protein